MKDKIKGLLTYMYTTLGSPNLLFPHINRILLPIVERAARDGCGISFLPKAEKLIGTSYREDVSFNYRGQTDNILPLERFHLYKRILIKFLYYYKIDYFVFDRLAQDNLWLKACLYACKRAEVTTVYLSHGAEGTEHPYVFKDIFDNYDYYYAPNTMEKNYLNSVAPINSCVIKEWKQPVQRRAWIHDKRLVVYAPQFNTGERFEHLYPDTLKYRHNLVILKLLYSYCQLYDKRLVWKELDNGQESRSPMRQVIETMYPDVEYVGGDSFDDLIKKAAILITDSVSTPFFTAAEMGIPVLCLRYSKASKVRDDIAELFYGSSIFVYDNIYDVDIELRYYFDKAYFHKRHYIEHNPDKFPWEN